MAEGYVGAIDQGTTSTRFILFDRDARIVAIDQREHEQINPRSGWVEHDAEEIWTRTREVIGGALAKAAIEAGEIEAIGIANQRETAVVWDRESGRPIHNAIVWQDTRTDGLVRELAGAEGVNRLRDRVGLPLSTYFSGPKVAWLLDHIKGARTRAAVEPDGRGERRRSPDRRHEREPHDADGSREPRLA
jgi:glycerol kinase